MVKSFIAQQNVSFKSMTSNTNEKQISEKQKLSVWGRQSTFAGSPSALLDSGVRNNRSRSENRTYGFGSAVDRFSAIQSQPNSPMQEKPLAWYVRDIDIGDSKIVGSESRPEPEMFGHRPMRRRSRHETHFLSGCHVPVGKGILPFPGIELSQTEIWFLHFFRSKSPFFASFFSGILLMSSIDTFSKQLTLLFHFSVELIKFASFFHSFSDVHFVHDLVVKFSI